MWGLTQALRDARDLLLVANATTRKRSATSVSMVDDTAQSKPQTKLAPYTSVSDE